MSLKSDEIFLKNHITIQVCDPPKRIILQFNCNLLKKITLQFSFEALLRRYCCNYLVL
uniref:Uncharacterized protein n=1 Tax=Octopus bimaculoides TaxID=37653 RepID=A0A0L8FNV9_OCTBM